MGQILGMLSSNRKETAQESDQMELSEFRRAQYPADGSGMCRQC